MGDKLFCAHCGYGGHYTLGCPEMDKFLESCERRNKRNEAIKPKPLNMQPFCIRCGHGNHPTSDCPDKDKIIESCKVPMESKPIPNTEAMKPKPLSKHLPKSSLYMINGKFVTVEDGYSVDKNTGAIVKDALRKSKSNKKPITPLPVYNTLLTRKQLKVLEPKPLPIYKSLLTTDGKGRDFKTLLLKEVVKRSRSIPPDHPDWACVDCGCNSGLFKITTEDINNPFLPHGYDVQCPRCGGLNTATSPLQALHERIIQTDRAQGILQRELDKLNTPKQAGLPTRVLPLGSPTPLLGSK